MSDCKATRRSVLRAMLVAPFAPLAVLAPATTPTLRQRILLLPGEYRPGGSGTLDQTSWMHLDEAVLRKMERFLARCPTRHCLYREG